MTRKTHIKCIGTVLTNGRPKNGLKPGIFTLKNFRDDLDSVESVLMDHCFVTLSSITTLIYTCQKIKCVSINNTEFDRDSWQMFCRCLAPKLEHMSSSVAVAIRQSANQPDAFKLENPFYHCESMEDCRITTFTLEAKVDGWNKINLTGVRKMPLNLIYIKMVKLGQHTYLQCSQVHQLIHRFVNNIRRDIVRYFRLDYPYRNVYQAYFYLPVLSLIPQFTNLNALNINLMPMIGESRRVTHRQMYYDNHIAMFRQLHSLVSVTLNFCRGVNALKLFREVTLANRLEREEEEAHLGSIVRLSIVYAKINDEVITIIRQNFLNIETLKLIDCIFRDKAELDSVLQQIYQMTSLEGLRIENGGDGRVVTLDYDQAFQLINQCHRLQLKLKTICLVNESINRNQAIQLKQLAKDRDISLTLATRE